MRISCAKRTKDGIALIIVMIVILVLGTLAAGFAYSMKVELRLAAQSNFDSQLEWLGRSGMELARFVLTEQDKLPSGRVHSLAQKWAGGRGLDATNGPLSEVSLEDNQLGTGSFSVKIVDNERKFNINNTLQNSQLLQQALMMMGVDASTSPTVSDSIMDWMDRDNDSHPSGAENEYYLALDTPYYCKNGWIDDMSELLLVKGIWDHPEIYYGTSSTNVSYSMYTQKPAGGLGLRDERPPQYACGLVDLFTSLSAGRININTAPPLVLRLLCGGDENIAAALIKQRAGPDGQDGTDDDMPFTTAAEIATVMPPGSSTAQIASLCNTKSENFTVTVEAHVGDYKRTYVGLLHHANNGGYVLLSFHGE